MTTPQATQWRKTQTGPEALIDGIWYSVNGSPENGVMDIRFPSPNQDAAPKTPRQQLAAITEQFRDMDDSILRMDCLLVLAAGDDNAGETLGWEETEEFFLLSLKSVECLLSSDETSDAVKAEFRAAGIRW